MAASTSVSTSLKEYLKRYETKSEDEKTKKKKKKKTKTRTDSMGILVVDEDPVWQKPVNLDEEKEDESADEEKPQVDEDIEVKRMKRLEQLRSRRPYHSISEDGSGWVSISETPKESDFNKENDDMSPPRQRRARYDTPSPEPELKTADSGNENPDVSPPRQRRRHYYTPSPERENPDRNLSPPLRSRTDASSEFEKRNSQWSSDKNGSKISLVEDLSPPRKSRKGSERSKSPDLFPPRRIRRHSPEVASNVSQVADLSPPRKSRRGSERSKSPDLSSPRRIRRQSPEVDGVSLVADLSPPRKSRKDSFLKEGQKAGLISRQDIREQTAKIREDSARLKDLDPSVSGRGAEPVYRDKVKGERISKEEFLKSQKGEEKPKEKKLEWGKGLAQKREAEAREHELEIEKDKPFARTRDDPELDKMLKERVRWGDPMAHLVKRKQFEPVLEDLGDNEKMKESGFIIPQEIPSHSWIKRGMDAAPNRYGIRPGRHWDGVDRSTGYEKEYFKRMNEKHATEREAYLWSVSDM